MASTAHWTDEDMLRRTTPITLVIGLVGLAFFSNYSGFHLSLLDILIGGAWSDVRWASWLSMICVIATIALAIKLPATDLKVIKIAVLLGSALGLAYPIVMVTSHPAVTITRWSPGLEITGWGVRFFALCCLSTVCVSLVTLLHPE